MGTLEDIASQIDDLPVALLLVGHFSLIALMFLGLREKYLLSFWVGFLGAVGGGVVSGYLLQDPKAAPNPIFAINGVFVLWTGCWWLINYFPGSLGAGLFALKPVRTICRVCTNILRAGTMVARVDAATQLFPGVLAAPLILGTLGASGGKFLVDAVLILSGISPGPAELTAPGFAWRSGALGTTVYYFLVHVLKQLTPGEGKALVTAVFIAHGLLSDLSNMPLDFTEPVARVLHAMTNIPMQPTQSPSRMKAVQETSKADDTAEPKKVK